MNYAIYNVFMPIYLDGIGYRGAALGTLLALGPLVSMAAQPVWGMAGDRAKTKNDILRILFAGSGLAILLYPVSSNFFYLIAAISAFTFFQSAINPLYDAITLEYLETTRWNFGPIRLAGTFGFAAMAVIAGNLARHNIYHIFILYSAATAIAFASSFTLPRIKGHQSEGKRTGMWELFKNKELMLLTAFNLLVQTSLGFYYSFFPVYYRQMGADNALVGWSMVISAMSELPFLLFASRIFKKIPVKYILLVSGSILALRWFLMYRITDVYAILPVMALHGLSFIVFLYSMATYISSSVPKELRASGQALNWLIILGISRISGSVIGGFLVDIAGIRKVFLYDSLFLLAGLMIFGTIFIAGDLRRKSPV